MNRATGPDTAAYPGGISGKKQQRERKRPTQIEETAISFPWSCLSENVRPQIGIIYSLVRTIGARTAGSMTRSNVDSSDRENYSNVGSSRSCCGSFSFSPERGEGRPAHLSLGDGGD